jgi:hypothetical protein
MTAAYQVDGSNDSTDLSFYKDFTAKLQQGYAEYKASILGSKVAPVGLAYQYLDDNSPNVWRKLTKVPPCCVPHSFSSFEKWLQPSYKWPCWQRFVVWE